MSVYFGLLFFAIFCYFLCGKLKVKNKKIVFCFLSILSLGFVSAIRNEIGVDFHNYKTAYENLILFNNVGDFEPGFVFIESFCAKYFGGFRGIIVITSFLIQGLTLYYFYRESPDSCMSICIYIMLGYYYSSLNQIRLYCAISIFLIAILFLKKKKFLQYVFCILIAALFHYTVLCMIPLYYFLSADTILRARNFLFAFLCVISLIFLIDKILEWGIIVFPKYKYYLNTFFNKGYEIQSLHRVIFIILPFLLLNLSRKENETISFYFNVALYALIVSFFQLRFQLFERFALYLSLPAACVGWPMLVAGFQNAKTRMLLRILIYFFLIVYHFYLIYRGWMGVFPYISIFNKV